MVLMKAECERHFNINRFIKYLLSFYLVSLYLLIPAFADTSQTTLPESGLIEWKFTDDNFQIQLIQRLPDQAYGFFEARGFPKKITTDIANSCIFQTIIHNTGKKNAPSFSVSLNTWKIKINKQIMPLKLKSDWDKQWQTESIKPASRLAFKWATFPTQQTFEPNGDYNWGMISFGPKPGSQFDLYIEWNIQGQKKSTWIKNIICAENR